MAPFFKNFLELAWRQSTVAISMRLCNAPHILPPPRKLSHRYATEVDFEIYDMGPLSPLHGRWLFHSQSAPELILSILVPCVSCIRGFSLLLRCRQVEQYPPQYHHRSAQHNSDNTLEHSAVIHTAGTYTCRTSMHHWMSSITSIPCKQLEVDNWIQYLKY